MVDEPSRRPATDPPAPVSDTEALIDGLGEIQRRGLRAATELVDALLGALDREPPRTRSRPGDPGEDGRVARAAGLDLPSLLAAVTDAANGQSARPSVRSCTIEVDGADPCPALRLVVPAADERSTDELVLRNPTATARSDLVVHGGELRSADGVVLRGRLRFDPESVDVLPARSSRGVRVSAELARDAAPGTYLGLVLVRGLPGAWATATVVVLP